jgi:hypothetical protein
LYRIAELSNQTADYHENRYLLQNKALSDAASRQSTRRFYLTSKKLSRILDSATQTFKPCNPKTTSLVNQ